MEIHSQNIGIHHTDWLLILFVFSAFLVVLARLYHPKKFAFFLTLPFNSGVKEFEEEFNPNGVKDPFDVLLTLNSYVIFSAGLFLVLEEDLGNWIIFARILFILMLFFLVKNFIELFMGWLFRANEGVVAAHNTSLAYRSWAALWIFPLLVLNTYLPAVKEITGNLLLIFLLLAYLMPLLLSSLRLWNLVGGTYYKILYLCALELIPFFFLISWFENL